MREGVARRRRSRRLRRALLPGLLVGVIFVAVIGLNRGVGAFRTIEIFGAQAVDPKEMRAALETYFSTSRWLVIPRRNALFYDPSALRALLLARFPRVEAVKASLGAWDRLVITVREREVQHLWCPTVEVSPCYFVDYKGYIFSEAPKFSDGSIFRIIGGDPISARVGATLRWFPQALALQKALSTFGTPVLLTRTGEDYELLLAGWKILTAAKDDTALVLSRARIALKSLDPATLDYLDLRFGTKVFYKRK